MKKALTLLVLISAASALNAMHDRDEGAGFSDLKKYGAGLVALGLSKYLIDEAGKTQFFHNACDAAELSSADLANVGGLSVGLATLGFMTNNQREKTVLYNKAMSVPVAAGVLWLASTKVFRSIAQKIPVIGEYFVCPNAECKGSCKDCKITKGLLGLGSYMIVRELWLNRGEEDGRRVF